MSANEKVQAVYAADRRLTVLRLLDQCGGKANTSVIEKGLNAFGHPGITREVVNTDARWLAAGGMIKTEELLSDLLVVTLTDRGERVARGEERVQGVARPSAD